MTQQLIVIKNLDRSPLNVRKTDSQTAMEELKASILSHGLMQNLVVVAIGECRVSPAAELERAPRPARGREASLRPCRALPDRGQRAHAVEMSLAENAVHRPCTRPTSSRPSQN